MPARRRSIACCIAAALLALATGPSSITANNTRDRTISLYNINTKETLTVQYMKGGKRIAKAMEDINWILRDWRKDEKTEMDPDLVDLLWEVHNELGSAQPINIISAYRSQATNEMLRKTVGGQASQSRHILGKAADVTFPDIPVKKLRYSALIRERGGVGYYPTSATPFVHLDTDRVRAWPRLPRAELALLFPSGRTQHVPDDGEPITKDDVRKARVGNPDLVAEITAFNDLRAQPKAAFQVASLAPSLPRLLSPPRLAERPAGLDTRPSERERARLAELAAAEPAPRLLQGPKPVNRRETVRSQGEMQVAAADPIGDLMKGNRFARSLADRKPTFVPAPAYDEEHPEELSYRPFPIAPFLTATASGDDPALARMVHPDFAKTLELLDQPGSALPMRLRPGLQAARDLWAHQFKGEAINLSALIDPETSQAPERLANRRVRTQAQ
ncbi:MAG TPA: DUF882 domain-containing protein [Hyphomicrobiaceae bacterium]|nr:DUF882 domain-containing protein [Hyphomicrobiaceae bacterium]